MKSLAVLLVLVLSLVSANWRPVRGEAAAEQKISFGGTQDGQLEIRLGDQLLAVFNHGEPWAKPFLYPLHAPNGQNVLREIIPTKDQQGSSKEGTDHFHHKGVWISVDSVNQEMLNFWHEGERIRNDSIQATTEADGSGTLLVQNTWLQGDQPLLKEETRIRIFPSRLLTYDIRLSAIDKDVTVGDTKEGFFAVRLAHTMREMQGGHIVNADGAVGEKEAWGKQSPWVDYYGEVDGETVGVTLMDHPGNFRKSRYHVRSYGLFAVSPFGPKAYSGGQEAESPVTIKPAGAPLQLTYGLYVHSGDTKAGDVKGAYQKFLEVTE